MTWSWVGCQKYSCHNILVHIKELYCCNIDGIWMQIKHFKCIVIRVLYKMNISDMTFFPLPWSCHISCIYWVEIFIYNIRRIAWANPNSAYALKFKGCLRCVKERNAERIFDFRCRRKPKCSEKTCGDEYGIDNQIHVQPWPDRESNPGRSGERRTNNRCSNPSPPPKK